MLHRSVREGEVVRVSPQPHTECSALLSGHSWGGFLQLAAAWSAQGSQDTALLGLLQVVGCLWLPASPVGQGPRPRERASAPARFQVLSQLYSAFK